MAIKRRRRSGGAGPWIKLVVALAAILVGAYFTILANTKRALESRLVRLRAMGVATTWPEFMPPPIPDRENAAVLYREALARLWIGQATGPESDGESLSALLWAQDSGERHSLLPAVERLLNRNGAALDILRKGSARPRCRLPLKVSRQASPHFDFDQFAGLTRCGYLLAADAVVAAEHGDARRAVESLQVHIRLSGHLVGQRGPDAFYLSTRAPYNLSRALRAVMACLDLPPHACRRLFNELQLLDFEGACRQALTTDLCWALWAFDEVERNPRQARARLAAGRGTADYALFRAYVSPVGELCRLREQLRYVECYEALLAPSARPYRDMAAELALVRRRLRHAPRYCFVTRRMVGTPGPTLRARDSAIAARSALQVALALEAYHTKRGRYPDALKALREYPAWTLPDDPFTGRPFAYHRRDAGFVLCSWGPDLDDDGGRALSGGTNEGDLLWDFDG